VVINPAPMYITFSRWPVLINFNPLGASSRLRLRVAALAKDPAIRGEPRLDPKPARSPEGNVHGCQVINGISFPMSISYAGLNALEWKNKGLRLGIGFGACRLPEKMENKAFRVSNITAGYNE